MRTLYLCTTALCALQRLHELRVSKRNRREMRAKGFAEVEPPRELRAMIAVHVAWFAGLLLEPMFVEAPPWPVAAAGLGLFLVGQALRAWVRRTLSYRWNISIVVPGAESATQLVFDGPYRFVRHPNYLAVILEFIGLPLMGGAYVTLVIGSLMNGAVLARRIATEEAHLMTLPEYAEFARRTGRLVPKSLRVLRPESCFHSTKTLRDGALAPPQ